MNVEEQGHGVYEPEGEAPFLEGMIADITDEQDLRQTSSDAIENANANAARLAQVLETTSDCVFSLNRDWQFTYLNKRAVAEIAVGGELRGRYILDEFPQLEQTPFWPMYQDAMRCRKPGDIEGFLPGLTEISIEPHYQPKVDLKSERMEGFEALLRWRHETHGIQLPDTISEAFKNYELAAKIGEIMQRKVFRDVRGWLDRDLSVRIAINASPAEFLRDDFAETFLERMRENSIPPSLVEVEVTEHVFLHRGSDYVGRALSLLKNAGIKIALDDFGTGHSSLSHLRDYPVDVLKIDGSFVNKMAADNEVRAIVSAVIGLARSLGIDVVAEGIETELQKQLLVQDGCGLGQGFYFGRAIPADEVPHLFRGRPKRLVA